MSLTNRLTENAQFCNEALRCLAFSIALSNGYTHQSNYLPHYKSNHQPLFHMCITLPVESAPFFIPSTSFCSLSYWFTSSCAYHLITVTTFALITYHCLLSFTSDLKLISFTNPFLHSHSYSFRPAFMDLNLYWIKGALLFVLVSGYVCYSAFESHRIASYHVPRLGNQSLLIFSRRYTKGRACAIVSVCQSSVSR